MSIDKEIKGYKVYIVVLSRRTLIYTLFVQFLLSLKDIAHQRLNLKMGILAGTITGSIVLYINKDYGVFSASMAFMKQFAFNFFMASYNTKLIERMVYSVKSQVKAIIIGGLFPTIIAITMVFLIHWIGHTPEAWKSTYWQAFFNLPIFSATAWMYCSGLDRKYPLLRRLFVTKSSIDVD